jgi:murein tripeptide amidase MpaA
LIPPYTYSRLLRDIEEFESSPHFKVEVLTHTITGLAIPLLTITKGAAKERKKKMAVKQKKKVILISGRIHPSETCSSYIIVGLIRELLREENIEEFLSDNIIKIVPMLNPDGVVFGNFRTSKSYIT